MLVRIAVRALLIVLRLLFLRVIRKLVVRVCVVGALPVIVLLLLKRLVLLLNELVTLSCFIQLRRIELLKILLLLEVLVEAGQVGSEAHNVIHFTNQDHIEVLYV